MASPETPGAPDPWRDFRFFLGEWTGTGSGKSGESTVRRRYALILADQFVEIKNQSEYAPQPSNPSGEVHADVGLLSFDKARSRFVLREFHVEGFVNQYVMQPAAPGSRQFVFETEAIENIAPGWRARTTVEILSGDSFRETFELAGPGQAWACFITNELRRVP